MRNRNITPRKLCFVTVGATASFDALIRSTLSPHFFAVLIECGYTNLRLQYGKDGHKLLSSPKSSECIEIAKNQGLEIDGFDFNKQGLGEEMRAAKGEKGGVEGVVISHAGSGSILDALRIAVPLVVVPNPSLLDNHQVELAEELAAQGYVIHGRLDDLPAAVRQSEDIRERQTTWPPNNEDADPSGKGLLGVMDDELGFVD